VVANFAPACRARPTKDPRSSLLHEVAAYPVGQLLFAAAMVGNGEERDAQRAVSASLSVRGVTWPVALSAVMIASKSPYSRPTSSSLRVAGPVPG